MNYQDYIWDLGGTLLDNYETSTAAFVHTLQDFGLTASHDIRLSRYQQSMQSASLPLEIRNF